MGLWLGNFLWFTDRQEKQQEPLVLGRSSYAFRNNRLSVIASLQCGGCQCRKSLVAKLQLVFLGDKFQPEAEWHSASG